MANSIVKLELLALTALGAILLWFAFLEQSIIEAAYGMGMLICFPTYFITYRNGNPIDEHIAVWTLFGMGYALIGFATDSVLRIGAAFLIIAISLHASLSLQAKK